MPDFVARQGEKRRRSLSCDEAFERRIAAKEAAKNVNLFYQHL